MQYVGTVVSFSSSAACIQRLQFSLRTSRSRDVKRRAHTTILSPWLTYMKAGLRAHAAIVTPGVNATAGCSMARKPAHMLHAHGDNAPQWILLSDGTRLNSTRWMHVQRCSVSMAWLGDARSAQSTCSRSCMQPGNAAYAAPSWHGKNGTDPPAAILRVTEMDVFPTWIHIIAASMAMQLVVAFADRLAASTDGASHACIASQACSRHCCFGYPKLQVGGRDQD
jgi:hypothetical protein